MNLRTHVLIDIENVQVSSSDLHILLQRVKSVYIVFALSPRAYSLDFFLEFIPYIKTGKLEFLKMEKVGKNSADFGLSYLAGRLSTSIDLEDSINIISKDAMLINIVAILKDHGIKSFQSPSIEHLLVNKKHSIQKKSKLDQIDGPVHVNDIEEIDTNSNSLTLVEHLEAIDGIYSDMPKLCDDLELLHFNINEQAGLENWEDCSSAENQQSFSKFNSGIIENFFIQAGISARKRKNALIACHRIVIANEENTYNKKGLSHSNYEELILNDALEVLKYLECSKPTTHRSLKQAIIKKLGVTARGEGVIRGFLQACGFFIFTNNRSVTYKYKTYKNFITILSSLVGPQATEETILDHSHQIIFNEVSIHD